MMRTRRDFIRLAPPEADVERWRNRTLDHPIIGDFGLAYGSAGLEFDRRDLNLGCYGSSI
jgi:hypothetical protein